MTESTMDPSMWRERAQRAEAEVENWRDHALSTFDRLTETHARLEVAERRLERVGMLVNDKSRHLVRWIDGSALLDVSDVAAILTDEGR